MHFPLENRFFYYFSDLKLKDVKLSSPVATTSVLQEEQLPQMAACLSNWKAEFRSMSSCSNQIYQTTGQAQHIFHSKLRHYKKFHR